MKKLTILALSSFLSLGVTYAQEASTTEEAAPVEEKKEKDVSLSNGERNNIDFDGQNIQKNVKEYGGDTSNFNNESLSNLEKIP